jgi:hypothetical protein
MNIQQAAIYFHLKIVETDGWRLESDNIEQLGELIQFWSYIQEKIGPEFWLH